MFRQSIQFLALAMSANALSYVYQLTMARMLEPREYATVLAIVSFIAIILFPSNSYQAAVAVGTGHLVARGGFARAWPFALRAALTGGAAALLVAFLFVVFAESIQRLFGFSQNSVLGWLMLTFFLSLVLSSFRGAFQGGHRFTALGTLMLLEALARVILAVLLVLLGFGVAGATAGFAFGYLGATILAVVLLVPRDPSGNGASESLWRTLKGQLRSVPATFAVFGVQAVDVVIANYRLPGLSMQSYSAAALAGRVIFYAGFVLSLLILPRFRDMFASQSFRRPLVLKSFSVMAVIAVPPVIAGFVAPRLIHLALVGPKYAEDPALLQLYLTGTAFLTAALFLTYVLISAGWTRVWLGVVPVAALQTAAYLFLARNTMDFARVLFASGVAMTAILGIAAALLLFRSASRATLKKAVALTDEELDAEIGIGPL